MKSLSAGSPARPATLGSSPRTRLARSVAHTYVWISINGKPSDHGGGSSSPHGGPSVHLNENVPQIARRIGLEPGSLRVNWSAVGQRENVDVAVAIALSAREAAGEQNCFEAWLLGFQPGDDAIEHGREMIAVTHVADRLACGYVSETSSTTG